MVDPRELKIPEISKAIRGYDIHEADAAIEYILKNYKELWQAHQNLIKKNEALYEEYKQATEDRETVKTALIDVKKAGDKIIAEANEKSDIIIQATKANCDSIINDFRRIVAEERNKLITLQAAIQTFKESLLSEYRQHMDMVDELTEIADSTLYFESDDEITRHAIDEMKTDVRYAMARKAHKENEAKEEVGVDLECFKEEQKIQAVNSMASTVIMNATAEADPSKTMEVKIDEVNRPVFEADQKPSLKDKYMEFVEELEINSNQDKE